MKTKTAKQTFDKRKKNKPRTGFDMKQFSPGSVKGLMITPRARYGSRITPKQK